MSQVTHNAIAQITEVVGRVTRMLSGRSIDVIQEGLRVGVEYDSEGAPRRVYLPSLSDNPSPELLTAIQGFLDKEVSSLLYTDHKTQHRLRGSSDFNKGMAKSLQEIIEDSRTERAMKGEFRGSAANFRRNHDFALEQIIKPKHQSATDYRSKVANLAMPAIRAAAGDLAYEEFMSDKWSEMGNLGGAILHYADDIQSIDNTKGTFDLTQKILRKWEELEQESGGGDEGDEGDEEGGGSGGHGSFIEGDEGDEGDDDAEGAGEGSDEEKEDESDDGTKPPKVEDLTKQNKKLDERKKRGESDGPRGSGTQQGLTDFEEWDDAFKKSNWNEAYQDKLKKFSKKDQSGSAYVPYSRQYDYVGPFINAPAVIKRFASDQTGNKIYEHATKNCHVIQQQVQKLFMAKSLTRWEPGLKRGKINSTALHRLSAGDPRVFRKKIESDSRDVAVSLLIDMSGSMSGAKVQYACIAALMFSQVLTQLNIKHEISAFTTYHGGWSGRSGDFPNAADVNKMLHSVNRHDAEAEYARFSPITNYIAKGYDERLTEDKKRLVSMIPSGYGNSMANNVDGESVEIAGRRLLARKEKKKVMIVMSDGSPAADGHGGKLDSHLKSVVKQLAASGIEMLGLGLMDTSVTRFYPKAQVVRQVEEIPNKILELTRLMVVGA